MPQNTSGLVRTDGRTYSGHRDPPGQSSIYIPPGDVWKESYRLSTFIQYPEDTPVIPAHLASSGFYYTGFKDRVKCFSCGLCVENWMLGDDTKQNRWHRSDCDFANGRYTPNEPMYSVFSQFRLAAMMPTSLSRQNMITTSPPRYSTARQSPSNSPTSSGNISASQSYSTPSQPMDIPPAPTVNHHHHHHHQSTTNSNNDNNSGITERERQDLFPCSAPVNPHMTSAVSRLESFKPSNGIRWPRERLRASIDELVNAGFFYLGERDRVKCWYCNGGLQNWDYDDEPWSEHAKWFPTCEFLLRVKGPAYVENIVAEFPNLNRPVPSVVLPTPYVQPQPAPAQPQPIAPVRTPSPPSGHQGGHGADDAVEEAISTLECVKQAREIGIDEGMIKAVLKRKYETNGQFYTSGEEFLEAIFSYQSRLTSTTESPESSLVNGSSGATSGTSIPSSTTEELEKLEETRRCKICKRDPSNVVLTPCGHLASCENCSNGLRKCPICSRSVRDVIKTFRA